MRQYAEAVVAYKKSSDLDPTNLDLKNRLRDAEEARERAYKVRLNPDGSKMTPAQIAKEEGTELFKSHNYDKAAVCYTKAIELAGDDLELKASCLNNRALCYSQYHNYTEVVKDCTQVLEIQPGNVKALIRRGIAYEALEKYQKGLDDMKLVLQLEPSTQVAMQAAHRLQKAVDQFNKLK